MEIGYFFCGDIMGFSKLIENLSNSSLNSIINDWISLIYQAADECNISRIQLLSDTVYAAANDSKEELSKLIAFSRILLNKGIKRLLPIRGAISFGHYNWDKLVYGKAVLDAHRLEKNQRWIGVTLQNSILLSNEENEKFGLLRYPVPLLEKSSLIHHSVIWDVPLFCELSHSLSLQNLPLSSLFLDKNCKDKIRNTAIYGAFLRQCRGLNQKTTMHSFLNENQGNQHPLYLHHQI